MEGIQIFYFGGNSSYSWDSFAAQIHSSETGMSEDNPKSCTGADEG